MIILVLRKSENTRPHLLANVLISTVDLVECQIEQTIETNAIYFTITHYQKILCWSCPLHSEGRNGSGEYISKTQKHSDKKQIEFLLFFYIRDQLDLRT